MNVKNNKRRRESQERIERVFIELLQTKEIAQISVSDICKLTGLNRSTFYANYIDIYDLADKIREKLELEVKNLYKGEVASQTDGDSWLRLLSHIRENQIFYKTYFKLGYDSTHSPDFNKISDAYKVYFEGHIEYHIIFFKAGFNALVKHWLDGGCKESPEEINNILKSEYRGRIY